MAAASLPELRIVSVPGDGNCLFYSVLRSLQHYNPDYLIMGERIADLSREQFMTYLRENMNQVIIDQINDLTGVDFSAEIIGSIITNCIWGTEPTILYLARLLQININVNMRVNDRNIIINHNVDSETTINIWYNGNNHYNAYLPIPGGEEVEKHSVAIDDKYLLGIYLNVLSGVKNTQKAYTKEIVLTELKQLFKDDALVQVLSLENLSDEDYTKYLIKKITDYILAKSSDKKEQIKTDEAIAKALAERKYYNKYLKYKLKYISLKKKYYFNEISN